MAMAMNGPERRITQEVVKIKEFFINRKKCELDLHFGTTAFLKKSEDENGIQAIGILVRSNSPDPSK